MLPDRYTYEAALEKVLSTPPAPSHDELVNSMVSRLLVYLDRLEAQMEVATEATEEAKLIRLATLVISELNRISRDQEVSG